MNLKELKNMIAEEYDNYMSEQEVAVSDADVDATEDGDAEEQLRDIYDMLKAYFEDEAGEEGGVEAPEDFDGVDADADEDEEAEALQERFKKLANIIKG